MPKAQKTPADDAPVSAVVTVEFNGSTFEIPQQSDDWPTEAWIARMQASTSGQLLDWLSFVELLLGPQQWKRLTKAAAGTKGEFKKFLDVMLPVVAKECEL